MQTQVLNKNGVILLPKEVYPLHPKVLLQASQAVIRNHLEHEEEFLKNIAELPQMTLQQPVKPILCIIRLLRPYDQVTVYLLETREVSNHLVNQGQINGWSLNLLQDFLRTFIDKKGQKLTINLRGSIEITFAQSAKFLLIQAQLYFLANKPKHGWIYLQKLFAAVLFQKTVRPSHDLSCKLFIKDSALHALIDTPYLEVRMQEYFAQHNQIKLLNPCLTSLIIRHRLE